VMGDMPNAKRENTDTSVSEAMRAPCERDLLSTHIDTRRATGRLLSGNAKLTERCSDRVKDQLDPEEASWGVCQERSVTSALGSRLPCELKALLSAARNTEGSGGNPRAL